MINKLLEVDKDFNEGMFITKVNNIFIMLQTAIMMNDLDRVRHFIGDDLEHFYEEKLKELNNKNLIQMYDELNVKTTRIIDVIFKDGIIVIKVELVSRYINYLINKDTKSLMSGDNTRRLEKTNYLIFEKDVSAHYKGVVRKCSSCGASIDINASGKCNYCGNIFKTEKYDYILTGIETI